MIYVELPDSSVRKLPFYLAMEEYVARCKPAGDYFFMWRVRPTVIFGRNQDMDAEVDTEFCRANDIEVYRRKSGGGCVYADMDNVMFSYITAAESAVSVTFRNYTGRVAEMLRSLGLDASDTSRNDILIGDAKVSGNAFYHLQDRSIVHGTMLYDADLQTMSRAITPSRLKLESRGVKSVRSRVTSLNRHIDMPLDRFMAFCRNYLCDSVMRLDAEDVKQIEQMAQIYYTVAWTQGGKRHGAKMIHHRVDGIGEFDVRLDIKADKICAVNLAGDFFAIADLDSTLLNRLQGVEYSRPAVATMIESVDMDTIIPGMTKEKMINILFD